MRIIVLILLGFAISSCLKHKEPEPSVLRQESLVSDMGEQYPKDKLLLYAEKVATQKQHKEIHKVTTQEIDKAKAKALRSVLKGTEGAFRWMGIPILSPTVGTTLSSVVDTYDVLEMLNRRMKEKSGFGLEVREDRAGFEYDRPF